MSVFSNDHEIKIGSETKRLTLVRQDGRALYQVTEEIPQYQEPLKFIQTDWIGGHGQYDFAQPDMYFEGQSIDTTQPGKVFLGPLIHVVAATTGDMPTAPVCFVWFNATSEWLCANAGFIYRYVANDTTIDTAEELDASETGVDCDANATTAIPVGSIIYVESEQMLVTAVSATGAYPLTVVRGVNGTTATTHTTDKGIYIYKWLVATTTVAGVTDFCEYNDIMYAALGSSALYYYSADGITWYPTDLTDGYAVKFLVSPNPAGTTDVFWKFKLPNKVTYTTDGRTVAAGGSQWSSDALIGDKSNDITNIFLIADNFMVGKEDNLFHYDSDGGLHPLRPDLRWNRSTDNFKYVTDWQTCTYFSEIRGMGEITQTLAYEPMGPLTNIDDIDKRGTIIGLTSDKDWIYIAVDEGTNTHIYKSREVRRAGGLGWEYCPFVSFVSATYPCTTMKVCQHSTSDKRLWFGYGTNTAYVTLSDNPLAHLAYTFAASGFVRMSYISGTNKYWDKMWQSVVTQTEGCASGITITPYYRMDGTTDTAVTALTAAISTTAGTNKTNLTSAAVLLSCNRIQFELDFVTATPYTATPQLSYFEVRGTEKPETIRIHECTYAIGDTPSKRAETIRTFLRNGRISKTLIKFADLRYQGPTPTGTTGSDYVFVVMLPGYPKEVEVAQEKDKAPELGIQVRWQEVSYS